MLGRATILRLWRGWDDDEDIMSCTWPLSLNPSLRFHIVLCIVMLKVVDITTFNVKMQSTMRKLRGGLRLKGHWQIMMTQIICPGGLMSFSIKSLP
jgi:hypothetical protein